MIETAASAPMIGGGYFFEQLTRGFRFRTMGRTLTETDLVNFINLAWFTEEVFVNTHDTEGHALQGRVVPGMLVYAFAEGLVAPSLQFTGLAFLNAEIDVKHPAYVGDTIHVEAEVTQARKASKGRRGLVRTENRVINQRGETVLVYTPLRLVKCEPEPARARGNARSGRSARGK
jgi:acyl dehydratase